MEPLVNDAKFKGLIGNNEITLFTTSIVDIDEELTPIKIYRDGNNVYVEVRAKCPCCGKNRYFKSIVTRNDSFPIKIWIDRKGCTHITVYYECKNCHKRKCWDTIIAI